MPVRREVSVGRIFRIVRPASGCPGGGLPQLMPSDVGDPRGLWLLLTRLVGVPAKAIGTFYPWPTAYETRIMYLRGTRGLKE